MEGLVSGGFEKMEGRVERVFVVLDLLLVER